MKNTFIHLFLIMILTTNSWANDMCLIFANIAEYSMEKRQNSSFYTKLGVKKGLQDIVDIKKLSQGEYDFTMHIIDEAFKVKQYENLEQRKNVINQFSNNVYGICTEELYKVQKQEYSSKRDQKASDQLNYNKTVPLCTKLSKKQYNRCINGLEGNQAPNCKTYREYMFSYCIRSNNDDELLKEMIRNWGKR